MIKPAIVAVLLSFPLFSQSQSLRVATYNIRYDNPTDTPDLWKNRYTYVAGLAELYDFDIFGTQEALKHQLDDLKKELKDYTYIGSARDDGKEQGEYCAVFYKTGKYNLMESGTFWLSQETNRPNKGWDAALPRICTWGKFKDISSGKVFYFFNTHFDHMGKQARSESARLMKEMIIKISQGLPFVFTGDFNFDQNDPNYDFLKNSGILYDTYDLAHFKYAPGGTFTAFDIHAQPEGRIDHIFVPEQTQVKRYGILTNTYNGRFPSDHFAVFAEIVLP